MVVGRVIFLEKFHSFIAGMNNGEVLLEEDDTIEEVDGRKEHLGVLKRATVHVWYWW